MPTERDDDQHPADEGSSGAEASGSPAESPYSEDGAVDLDQLILIVVGAHLRAEMTDRQLAYRMREQALRMMDQLESNDDIVDPLTLVVCTDLWYLNHPELMARPTIAIGDPEKNSASAYLGNKVPTAFVVDESFRVHLDMEYIDLHACLWGASHGATASAVDLFVERYLEEFLKAAH